MTIHAVKLYKLNDIQWVFDDPGRNIYAEAFVAGADTLVDRILRHEHLNPEGNLVLQFSTITWAPFTDTIYKLNYDTIKNEELKEGQGTYYIGPESHSLWLCPTLLDYYDEPPAAIFVKIKGEHVEDDEADYWQAKAESEAIPDSDSKIKQGIQRLKTVYKQMRRSNDTNPGN